MVTHTLGTESRINLVDLLSLRDRPIGALRLADITVDTFVGNQKRHSDRQEAVLN